MKKMIYATLIGLAGGVAQAKDVELFGEYGCDSFEIQQARLQLATSVFRVSALKAQGLDSASDRVAQDDASKAMVDMSNRHCKQLTGTYKQISAKKLPGGTAIQIQYDKSTTLWVMQ